MQWLLSWSKVQEQVLAQKSNYSSNALHLFISLTRSLLWRFSHWNKDFPNRSAQSAITSAKSISPSRKFKKKDWLWRLAKLFPLSGSKRMSWIDVLQDLPQDTHPKDGLGSGFVSRHCGLLLDNHDQPLDHRHPSASLYIFLFLGVHLFRIIKLDLFTFLRRIHCKSDSTTAFTNRISILRLVLPLQYLHFHTDPNTFFVQWCTVG